MQIIGIISENIVVMWWYDDMGVFYGFFPTDLRHDVQGQ